MVDYINGTLLISNILLIWSVVVYGFLIVKKKKKESSNIWLAFLIACALFFLSEFAELLSQFIFLEVSMVKSVLRLSFGAVILFAFISKLDSLKK